MKKNILFLIPILFFSIFIHAQFQGSIGEIGLGYGKTTMNPFTWTNAPTGPNGQLQTTLNGKASSPMSFAYIGADNYAKHFLIQTTFGPALQHKVKEFPEIKSKRNGDEVSLRFAAGGYIKEVFGLMVGVHYQYIPVLYYKTTSTPTPQQYNSTGGPMGTFFAPGAGGNLYGFNVNGMISLGDQILIRYTYLYSLASNKYLGSGKYKGTAGQSELAAFLIFDNNKKTGLFLKFTSFNCKMNPVTNADVQFSYSGSRSNVPALDAKSIWVTVGYARNFD